MKIIGSGNTGSKLALMFDEDALLFSTAHQDSNNFIGKNIITFSERGASKKFTVGARIWEEKYEKLKEELDHIHNDNVVIFAALGGGSGSSSLLPMSEILLGNGNKVLIVGILPFKKEINPPLANAVQAINNLMPVIADVSLVIFDNNALIKEFEHDWSKINNYIVKRVDYMINLLDKYNTDGFSPLTLDQSELESVVFGGGFIDISESFLERYDEDGNMKFTMPKFTYGRLDRTTKNCLMVMFVDDKIKSKNKLDEYHQILSGAISRIATTVRNARMIPGILRAEINYSNSENESINDRAYVTIASGLNIDRYLSKIEKIRDDAIERASEFSKKIKGKTVIKKRDKNILDI